MADQATADPDTRGSTTIEAAVLERIAVRAARDVDGVTSTGSDLEQLIGRRLPKADARVAGSRARVHLDIATTWPHPVAGVAAEVRDHVTRRLSELTGLDIDAVDVQVARVVQRTDTSAGRAR